MFSCWYHKQTTRSGWTAKTKQNCYLAAAEVQRDVFQIDVAGQAEQQRPGGTRPDATLPSRIHFILIVTCKLISWRDRCFGTVIPKLQCKYSADAFVDQEPVVILTRETRGVSTVTAQVDVSEVPSHLSASGGSLVPDTLMELREAALLKKCLNEGGTSLPFLEERPEKEEEADKKEDGEEGEEKFSDFKSTDSIMQELK